MPRPAQVPLDSASTGWVTRFNDNTEKVIDAPAPLALYADAPTLTTAKKPKLNADCLAMVGGTGGARIHTSDGTDWNDMARELLTFVPDFVPASTPIADIKDAYNALVADMIAKGYMDPS